VRRALRIPYRDWRDIALAALVIPQETYAWLQVGWFLKAWAVVLTGKLTRRRRDLWAFQYEAERR
jgi:hypothetical protein